MLKIQKNTQKFNKFDVASEKRTLIELQDPEKLRIGLGIFLEYYSRKFWFTENKSLCPTMVTDCLGNAEEQGAVEEGIALPDQTQTAAGCQL